MAKPALSVGTRVWAEKITAAWQSWQSAWQSSIDGIFATGRMLANAKLSVPRGDFEKMIENDLPFSPQTARKLMSIASDKRLSEGAHVRVLPPHWGTLYELTKLKTEQFEQAIKDGLIHPDMERKDVPRPLHRPKVIDVEHKDITESPATMPLSAEDAVPAEAAALPDATSSVTANTADDGPHPVVTADSEGGVEEPATFTYSFKGGDLQAMGDLAMVLIRGLISQDFTGYMWARGHSGDFTVQEVNGAFSWTGDAAEEFEKVDTGAPEEAAA